MVKGKKLELIGNIYGKLKVIEKSKNIGKDTTWLCLCECGNEKVIRTRSLVHEGTSSCGCISKEFEDLTGKVFNYYIVISYYGKTKSNNTRWTCRCKCGEIRIVTANNLKNSNSKSCGCMENVRSKTHNLSRSSDKLTNKIYSAWSSMRDRCNNSNNKQFEHYGGRGISVCNEWDNLENGIVNFYNWSILNDVEIGLSIDRIDNNGNYEPSNCRWVDYKTQNNNRRSNRHLEYNGEILTASQWSDRYEISTHLLLDRLNRGWSIERALTEKINESKGSNQYVKRKNK